MQTHDQDPANLEFSPSQMAAMGSAVLRRVVDHLATIQDQAVRGEVDAAELCRTLREPAPEQAAALEPLLDSLFNDWIPRTFNTASPGYLAYIPSGGVFPATLAELIANGVNRYTGVWLAAPALVQLEANALEWLREWMQFPNSARGLFTTGGSMANFTAVVCARERGLGPDIRAGTMYTSDQVHHSVAKSARLAGIMPDRIRSIPVDDAFRMRMDVLAENIARDRATGLEPFLVVSSAGTTNTGAIDPLQDISALCREQDLWHHVDGAYGAFFHMCPELRPLLAGLPQADSLTLDPHKGMFLPYGTGALLVADGESLRAAHSVTASYMPTNPDDAELYDPHQYGPDLSRGFPGLRVWLSVKLFGAERYRAAIAEKRTLALDAARRVAAIPHLVMDAPPQLSLFAFHLDWPGSTHTAQNEATRELLERVTRRGKVMLTGCEVDGRYLGRVCILSFRTRRDRVDACVEHLAEESHAIIQARLK
ncbi:MAG TPA: aminotransferase class V-fold PLP-dependent enzyme [Steroidobacteraceae bacterium]|nr:aminotransferase class V-fold PLP-dependent enzyme [Steroidobacteraceae bacterium]